MSLYQSYRPKNFSDVVGQDFVKRALARSCITETIHHGYIFFGFHGIGKTTLARIFAEAVNCTSLTSEGNPCHNCPNCLAYDNGKMIDVIEIDAASYTGVDNIREIIDHAKFTPTQGKYKVYIIDEVHMLSKGAFNALLKTLEEPPEHVIFLLATTEIHKVPDTILSRVIRFDLTKINERDMYNLLVSICQKEGVKYEETSLSMVSHRARGSIRDSLTMLEKCIVDGEVTEKNVSEALHLVNHLFLEETFTACRDGDAEKIQHIVDTLDNESIDITEFSAQMTEWVVEHIGESFETNSFPIYREIFDLFTEIFGQSKEVSEPMDYLRMMLYSRIKNGKLAKTTPEKIIEITAPLDSITPVETIEAEKNLIEPAHHELESEKGMLLESAHHELESGISTLMEPANHVIESTDIEVEDLSTIGQESSKSGGEGVERTPEKVIETEKFQEFSPQNYLAALQNSGIKSTLLPLLKTATMQVTGNTLEITTTSFCKTKCEENGTQLILEKVAKDFGISKVTISSESPIKEEEKQEDIIDTARDIFK